MATFRQTVARSLEAESPVARANTVRAARTAKIAKVIGLELALVATRDGFDGLEADWNSLFARVHRSHQVFQAFNWNWHWANHFLTPDRSRPALRTVCPRPVIVSLFPPAGH